MQKVVPAILTASPEDLKIQLTKLKNESNWVHIDIMDGKFVPNTSVNLFELGDAYNYFNLEIHLMVKDPEKYFQDCREVGAKRVIFHVEGTQDAGEVLRQMEGFPFRRILAVNPGTPLEAVRPYADRIDGVLIMSVNPGFQEQEFVRSALSRAKAARDVLANLSISLDGGINKENIREVFACGATYVNVGSAVMKAENPAAAFKELQQMV